MLIKPAFYAGTMTVIFFSADNIIFICRCTLKISTINAVKDRLNSLFRAGPDTFIPCCLQNARLFLFRYIVSTSTFSG